MTTRVSGEKRGKAPDPQRRAGGPRKGEAAGDASARPPGSGDAAGSRGARRSRRRGAKRDAALQPAAVVARVAQADAAPEPDRSPEEPLTEEELAVMRQHFRFLRDHRKVLHLRVNAQEDLLLNEKRVPTRRGVCQHLLAKVDRARVFAAAERLDPAAAARLAEGVLRIAPDLDYLLLYLQCVGRAGSQQQAISALAQALASIDCERLSQGQVRRILDLLVELFDERQRPQVLFGLLENPGFRRVFDRSVQELPEALAAEVAPLRAVQLAVLRGERNPLGPQSLERGLALSLAPGSTVLRRCSPAARWRLAEHAIEGDVALSEQLAEALQGLLESLEGDEQRRGALMMAWAKRLLGGQRDAAARRVLSRLAKGSSSAAEAQRWLRVLDAPRWGRVALIGGQRSRPQRSAVATAPGDGKPAAALAQRRSGVCLETLRAVHIIGVSQDSGGLSQPEASAAPVFPGVAPIWQRGVSPDGEEYLVVGRFGRGLRGVLRQRPGPVGEEVLGWLAEAVFLLSGLADCGLGIPDADLRRFEVSDGGRLWFVDPQELVPGEPSALQAVHGRHATALGKAVLDAARGVPLPNGLAALFAAAPTARELAASLAIHMR